MLNKENFFNRLNTVSSLFRPTTFEHNLIEYVFADITKNKIKEDSELHLHRQSDTLICYQGNPKVAFVVHCDVPLLIEKANGAVESKTRKLQDAKGNVVDIEDGKLSKPKFVSFPYQDFQKVEPSNKQTELTGYLVSELAHLCLVLEVMGDLKNYAFAITQGFYQNSRGTIIAAQYLENIESLQNLLCLESMENDFFGKGPSLGMKVKPQEKALNHLNPGNIWNLDFNYSSIHGSRLDQFGIFKDWVCGGLPVKNKGTVLESVSMKDISTLYEFMADLSQWKSVSPSKKVT